MMKSPNVESILQKIRNSKDKQRELENEQVRTLDKLNNARTSRIEEVPSLQSTLRELEKKIELERVQYEEYMLELTLTKKDEHKLSRDDIINSTHQNLYTPASSIFSVGHFSNSQSSTPVPTLPTSSQQYFNNNLRDDLDEVSAINNINAMLAQATSSIRNENESLLAGLNGTRSEELKKHQMQILEQKSSESFIDFLEKEGPKFVSDEEIERIKAKIEEDNRAIAALESKKDDSYLPRSTTITRYESPSLDSRHTVNSEDKTGLMKRLEKEIGGLSSITGSASSPYIPSSDFSPLPPLRSQISVPGSVTSSMFRPGQTSVGNGLGSRSLASMLASTSGGGLHESLAHYTTTTASPLFDPMPGVSLPSTTPSHHLSSGGMMGGHQGGGGDPLLDNSNLCDILMLERALETEAAMGGGMSAAREALSQSLGPGAGAGENRVDMLEIPGKGRCYVYLARYTYEPFSQSTNDCPESELPILAGDYVLVWGEMDEDGYLEAELLDGRRGLVPSNYITKLVGEDLMEFHQSMVIGTSGIAGQGEIADDGWSTSIPQDLPMQNVLRDIPSSAALTPEPVMDSWEEHQHLMNPMFLQSPDEIDLPPLDPELLEHRRHQQDEDGQDVNDGQGAVPPPKQLTLERQLNKRIIEMYHVYVDGFLKTTVRASDKTRALVEGVDSTKPHRISVRSVTINRRTSRDAACTMIIGKDAPLGPSCVKAASITSTSAVISWLPSNSNFQHTVSVNGVEVRAVKPGVYRHTITGLTPNTTYRVSIRAKNIKASPYVDEKSLIRLLEKLSAHTEFRTLKKGLPDPPMDVRVDPGPQDGTVLVTWIPVTLNVTAGGKDKTSPVTGYAVFADGKRVTDVDSPSSDHALVDLACIGHFNPKNITVRSKSRDLLSTDSVCVPVPVSARRREKPEARGRMGRGRGLGRGLGARRGGRREMVGGQMVIDHDDDNLSDKEVYSKNIPAIAGDVEQYSDEEYNRRGRGGPGERAGPGARGRRGFSRDRGTSRIFVALFDYDPPTMSPNPEACDEELPFREGQLIKIIGEKDADGFYWGECGGRSGYVPCNMVSEVQVDDERVARELLKDDQRMRGGRGGWRGGDRWGDIYAGASVKKMIALYDYDPMELSPNVDMEVELNFQTGDIIMVFGEMDDDGFYMAELRGQRGLVPSNFLTEAPGQYTGPSMGGPGGLVTRGGGPGVMMPGPGPQMGGPGVQGPRTSFPMYPQGDLTQPQYMNNVVPQQQFAGPTAMATGDQQLQGPGILSRVKEAFMQNGMMGQQQMQQQQMMQQQPQQIQQQQQLPQQQVPASQPQSKTGGLMGGLFGGMSKLTGAVGAATTTSAPAQTQMAQPVMTGMNTMGMQPQQQMGMQQQQMGMQQQPMQQPMMQQQQPMMQQQQPMMQQPVQQQQQQPQQQQQMAPAMAQAAQAQPQAAPAQAAAAAPAAVNLDNIPGLDDFGPGAGANAGISGGQAKPEGGGLLGGLTGGLTGGLQSGLGGLTGAASGGIGKLGDVAGGATGAASNLLSGGKGLFKKFGF